MHSLHQHSAQNYTFDAHTKLSILRLVCAMAAPNFADTLRAAVDRLERESGLEPDHPDLLELKGVLLAKAEALEAETNATLTEPPPGEESATRY